MSSSGSPVKRERVLVLFKEFDEDQDGIITFDEFLAIVANEDATSG
jgi:Ca2+-binding EF-hand superfamily protein